MYDLPHRLQIQRHLKGQHSPIVPVLLVSIPKWGGRENIYRERPGRARNLALTQDMLRMLAIEGRA